LPRDEFPQKVRVALAKRASYICSNPECRALTVAPADSDLSDVLFIGKAAHICAASEGGARYDGTMTTEERKAISNGIFLCSSCADLIDRNNGGDYAVKQLSMWKRQHEDWVRANLNKRIESPPSIIAGKHEASGVGDVTALDIQGSAIIQPGTISRATGRGHITGTRIGPKMED